MAPPTLPGPVPQASVAAQPSAVDVGVIPGYQLPGTGGTPPRRRIQLFVGSLVRTLIVAALVAGAVIGGRYGSQWYQDRQAGIVADLPAEPIVTPDYRSIRIGIDGSHGEVELAIDLMTGEALAVHGEVMLARRDGELWLRENAGFEQIDASSERLRAYPHLVAAIDGAFIPTISDVLPVEMREFVSVVSDDTVAFPGSPVAGESVIEVGDLPASATDGSVVLSRDDEMIGEFLVGIEDPVGDQLGAGDRPVEEQIAVRKVEMRLDAEALARAHPILASRDGDRGEGERSMTVWLDRTGVIRQMALSTPDGVQSLTLRAFSTKASTPASVVPNILPVPGIEEEGS